MRTKSIILSLVAFICFAVTANAQKVAVAVVDQHYAAEASHYKYIMGVLAAVYFAYVIMHNKRRKEVNQFLGKSDIQ